jgi:hypothetical protein
MGGFLCLFLIFACALGALLAFWINGRLLRSQRYTNPVRIVLVSFAGLGLSIVVFVTLTMLSYPLY